MKSTPLHKLILLIECTIIAGMLSCGTSTQPEITPSVGGIGVLEGTPSGAVGTLIEDAIVSPPEVTLDELFELDLALFPEAVSYEIVEESSRSMVHNNAQNLNQSGSSNIPASGRLKHRFRPQNNTPIGPFRFTVQVTDQSGNVESRTFVVEIKQRAPQPPLVQPITSPLPAPSPAPSPIPAPQPPSVQPIPSPLPAPSPAPSPIPALQPPSVIAIRSPSSTISVGQQTGSFDLLVQRGRIDFNDILWTGQFITGTRTGSRVFLLPTSCGTFPLGVSAKDLNRPGTRVLAQTQYTVSCGSAFFVQVILQTIRGGIPGLHRIGVTGANQKTIFSQNLNTGGATFTTNREDLLTPTAGLGFVITPVNTATTTLNLCPSRVIVTDLATGAIVFDRNLSLSKSATTCRGSASFPNPAQQ